MDDNFAIVNVTCPKCNYKFKINVKVFGMDDELTCFNCGTKFTIRNSAVDSIKREIPKIKAELERHINEAEKGNIKLSVKDLKEMRDALKKSGF